MDLNTPANNTSSLFSLNEKTLQLQTKYAHLQYNEENYLFAAILASSLYEYYIHIKTDYRFVSSEYPLSNAIRNLSKMQTNYSYEELDKLRDCRNNLIHNKVSKNKYLKCTKRILNFLEYELFGETLGYFDVFERQHILELLKNEQLILNEKNVKAKKFKTIYSDDFFNLYEIRDKFMALKKILESKESLIELGLSNGSVSHVDGTSGYVWLSMFGDELKYKVEQLSLSILATPESIRIYFDFGGKAYEERKRYLKLLANKDFILELQSISDTDDLYFFDIEWYHTIVSKIPFKAFMNDNLRDIDKILTRLENDYTSKGTITWNKYLVGYVIQRKDITKESIINHIDSICSVMRLLKKKI